MSFIFNKSAFDIALYIECLEEISFLYEHRESLFNDIEIAWIDVDDLTDEKCQCYIDILSINAKNVIDICNQQAIEGDFGELYAAVRVFCRHNRQDLVEEVLEELDFDDEERVKAVSDALCHELPESWQESLIPLLFEKGPETTTIAVDVIAFQRLPFENDLIKALNQYPLEKSVVLSGLKALGRIRSETAVQAIQSFSDHEDPEISQKATFALLRIGKKHKLSKPWSLVNRGLSGDKNEFSEDNIDITGSETALAIGLIGQISAISELIESLSTEDTAENGSLALNLITGAELYEDHFVAEEIDEDMLFEDELEKHKKGELYAPGEEPGETITRLSQNPETWRLWWDENTSNFDPNIRYRNGKPYSPECLIENLKSEKSPNIIRKLAYEELVIRYGINFPFETDMLVKDQIVAIEQYEGWVKNNPNKFVEGKWYFNGSLI